MPNVHHRKALGRGPLQTWPTRNRPGGRGGGSSASFVYDWRKHRCRPSRWPKPIRCSSCCSKLPSRRWPMPAILPAPFDRERCGVVVGTAVGGDFCDELEMGLRLPEMQRRARRPAARSGDCRPSASPPSTPSFADTLLRHVALACRRNRQLHHQHAGFASHQNTRSGRRGRGSRQRFHFVAHGAVDLLRHAALGRQRPDDLRGRAAPHGRQRLQRPATPRNCWPASATQPPRRRLRRRSAGRRRGSRRAQAPGRCPPRRRPHSRHHPRSGAGASRFASRGHPPGRQTGLAQANVTPADYNSPNSKPTNGSRPAARNSKCSPAAPAAFRRPAADAQFADLNGDLCGVRGIIALIKAVLEIEHGQIVPTRDSIGPAVP